MEQRRIISPATARNIIDIESRAACTLNFWCGIPQTAGEHRQPQREQQVADDRAGERGLDDRDQAVLEGEYPDDQFRRIAHRRVQEPPEGRPEVDP